MIEHTSNMQIFLSLKLNIYINLTFFFIKNPITLIYLRENKLYKLKLILL